MYIRLQGLTIHLPEYELLRIELGKRVADELAAQNKADTAKIGGAITKEDVAFLGRILDENR
jgi:hypothetical protein